MQRSIRKRYISKAKLYPEGLAAFKQLEAKAVMLGPGVKASPLEQAYPDIGPNTWSSSGGHWEAASAMQGSMALCGPQTNSSQPSHPATGQTSLPAVQRGTSINNERNTGQSNPQYHQAAPISRNTQEYRTPQVNNNPRPAPQEHRAPPTNNPHPIPQEYRAPQNNNNPQHAAPDHK